MTNTGATTVLTHGHGTIAIAVITTAHGIVRRVPLHHMVPAQNIATTTSGFKETWRAVQLLPISKGFTLIVLDVQTINNVESLTSQL